MSIQCPSLGAAWTIPRLRAAGCPVDKTPVSQSTHGQAFEMTGQALRRESLTHDERHEQITFCTLGASALGKGRRLTYMPAGSPTHPSSRPSPSTLHPRGSQQRFPTLPAPRSCPFHTFSVNPKETLKRCWGPNGPYSPVTPNRSRKPSRSTMVAVQWVAVTGTQQLLWVPSFPCF